MTRLGSLRIKGLLERDTKLLAYRLEFLDVLFVLALVLDFVLDALKNSHGRGEVVDSPCGPQSRDNDRGRGDEIVGKAVVKVSLKLENIIDLVELLLISSSELLKRLLGMLVAAPSCRY